MNISGALQSLFQKRQKIKIINLAYAAMTSRGSRDSIVMVDSARTSCYQMFFEACINIITELCVSSPKVIRELCCHLSSFSPYCSYFWLWNFDLDPIFCQPLLLNSCSENCYTREQPCPVCPCSFVDFIIHERRLKTKLWLCKGPKLRPKSSSHRHDAID